MCDPAPPAGPATPRLAPPRPAPPRPAAAAVTSASTGAAATARDRRTVQNKHIREVVAAASTWKLDPKDLIARAGVLLRPFIAHVASPPDRRSLSGQPLPVAGVAGLAVAGAGPGGGGGGAGQYDDDQPAPATPDQAGTPPPDRNGQLAQQGSLTIVRRSSTKKAVNNTPVGPTVIRGGAPGPPGAPPDDSLAGDLESLDLTTECLPAVDTPDACDKAAFRLRCLLRQLQLGQVSADLLQSNLLYAARVLEAVFIDETKGPASRGNLEASRDGSPPADNRWVPEVVRPPPRLAAKACAALAWAMWRCGAVW
ncbi:atherin-like isoform X3 [Frankliniella occidentalis]|uniref:Atherin-like isoform X3 n=1 Tax=Frankliniella occidentalis TaxID=133901 RepID=A0A9C6X0H0_FRAOC|nr:atherin-like isoform X3 [Frankliniella occidentalis]